MLPALFRPVGRSVVCARSWNESAFWRCAVVVTSRTHVVQPIKGAQLLHGFARHSPLLRTATEHPRAAVWPVVTRAGTLRTSVAGGHGRAPSSNVLAVLCNASRLFHTSSASASSRQRVARAAFAGRPAKGFVHVSLLPRIPLWGRLLVGTAVVAGGMIVGATVLLVVIPVAAVLIGGSLLARRIGVGPLAWVDRVLGSAARDLASNATAIQRMHYVLTTRLRTSPTVIQTVGRGLELGIPLMTDATRSGEREFSIRFGSPLVHPMLGHRGLVVIDAVRRPVASAAITPAAAFERVASTWRAARRSSDSTWLSAATAAAAEARASASAVFFGADTSLAGVTRELEQRCEERVARRRERQRARPARNPSYSTESEELEDAREFYEDARADIAEERRLRGGVAAGLEGDLEIVDAVLQLPSGEEVSLAHELVGAVTDARTFDARVNSSRIIDAEVVSSSDVGGGGASRRRRHGSS